MKRKTYLYSSLIVLGVLCQFTLTPVQSQTKQHITQLNHKEAANRLYGAYALGLIGSESAVRPLIQLLKDNDANVRLAAIDALGAIGSEKALDQLKLLLSSSESSTRAHAANAVVKIVSPQEADQYQITRYQTDLNDKSHLVRKKAVEELLKLDRTNDVRYQRTKALSDLEDPAVSVRVAGCQSLGEIGGQKSVLALTRLLSDPVPTVRVASLEAIGSLIQQSDEQTIESAMSILLSTLSDPDLMVQQQAGKIFVSIGLPAASRVLESSVMTDGRRVNPIAVGVLVQMGVPIIEVLTGKLDADDEMLRNVALQVLEIIQPDQSSNHQILKSQADLKDQDADIRVKGLKQLGLSGTLVDGVIDSLNDPEAKVRQQATIAIGQIGDSVMPELLPLLSSSNGSVRWHAIVAVGLMAEQLESDARLQVAVDPLLDSLSNADRSIREVALTSLKKIGSSALDQVTIRLRARDPITRALAADIAIDLAPEQADSIRLSRYIGDLKDQDSTIQSQALSAIRQLNSSKVIQENVDVLVNQHLIVFATDSNSALELRQNALLTLAKVAEICSDSSFLEPLIDTLLILLESEDLQLETAKVLSQVGKPAVKSLINRLAGQDGQVRSAITKTLIAIGQPAVANLTAALSNSSHQVRRNASIALGQIDPDHADEFETRRYINDLQDENSQVRINGAKLLKVYGNQNSVKPLLVGLADSNYQVRLHSAKALAEIGDKKVIDHLDQARKRKEEIKVVKAALKDAIDHLKELP